ncbi:MAG TPA: hypothetical protein PKD38_16200 [Nitrospira sp.]|nr:hypothetical protein [Nitrospira sp.]
MKETLALAFVLVLAAGCAVPSYRSWSNEKIANDRERMEQMIFDKGLCWKVADNEGEMPEQRVYMPIPSGGYTFAGNISTTGSNGLYNSQVNGVATPRQTFATGFAQGYNQGLVLGEAIKQNDRRKTFNECMVRLGWSPVQ